jgi:crossover junction endodeoxyribonuclease RuvC
VGISPQQFEQLQKRLSGARKAEKIPPSQTSNTTHEIILGIDPSLRGTGYGVIRLSRPTTQTLAHGTISVPQIWEHSRCLVKINHTLRDVIAEHRPTLCVVEGLFHAHNVKTAIVMGQARGAALVAAAEAGLEICEISPRKMKLAIVGYGAAQKSAVATMVQRMLNLAVTPDPDAADALALALAFAQGTNRYSLAQPKRI